ncbi:MULTISPECIES: phosphatidylinositol-specific phospholipase C [Streptomyces]|uniref:phosphatidylinositol-specific phospholipase C n=1 Tax=Streptomyces TaxID=1883 RepID=UPI0022581384|nr:phosphatidylinositol-specific phospholipase C [Streptomyces virginiae]MCX4960058.1 phosphatidylinositol-specific phospholipase C [Streptomyces virginiae]
MSPTRRDVLKWAAGAGGLAAATTLGLPSTATAASWSARSWMGQLSNSLPVTGLTIPGTHQTCANSGWPAAKCQDWDLGTQLGNGIRFLDIRLNGLQGSANEMGLYHAAFFMNKRFADVLNDCDYFLRNNPKEVIIMRVKNENSGGQALDAEEFRRRFNWHLDDPSMHFRPRFFTGDSWPTLGQARGKIVLLTDFDHTWTVLKWDTHCIIQDDYNVSDDEKRKAIVRCFDAAWSDRTTSKMFINFTSTAKGPVPEPSIGAQKIFPSVYAYLEPRKTQRARFGIVPMDFPNYRPDIMKLLIDKNFV